MRGFLQLGHHAAHGIGQGLAGQRGTHAARMAFEQAHVQHPLEFGQRLRGRRLAHVHMRGGLHDGAALLQGQQQLQLAQAHMPGQP
ncbi:hypothetical protein D3C78_1469500 [compost metagenome]